VQCTSASPAVPAAISGGSLICPNASLTYSIVPVAGANSYTWTLPPGWTGNSTTTSIAVTANGTGGVLKVKAANDCGSSGDQVLSIAINPNPCRRGVHFDGENDHLAVGQNAQALSGDLTISFWIKPDLLSGEQTVIFNGREFIVGLSDSQIRYKHSDDCCGYDNTVDMVFPGNLELGKWTNVAITRATANRTVNLYLNGNFVQSQTYGASSAQPGDNSADMIFGAGKNGAWANFKGSLDEIRIWNTLRSLDELKRDLVCYPTGNEADLKAYYDFEKGQPYGDNQAVTNFSNLVSAYGVASVRNMAMSGTTSNVVSGDLPAILFQDLDGDGFGGAIADCNYTGQTVLNSNDCDDNNSAIYPGATEIPNGLDDDCDGIVDDSIMVSSVKSIFPGEIQFALRPNPADEVLHIVFEGAAMAIGRVEIFNLIGQRLLMQDIQVEPHQESVLHIEDFPQGSYFLVFRRADGLIAGRRFVILRVGQHF
jgi:hypothetical protein